MAIGTTAQPDTVIGVSNYVNQLSMLIRDANSTCRIASPPRPCPASWPCPRMDERRAHPADGSPGHTAPAAAAGSHEPWRMEVTRPPDACARRRAIPGASGHRVGLHQRRDRSLPI
ncbi:hypothetical protein EVAR_10924_1 [Eumeta japonica]|uniref:Uncharacterized protein n=1 Tax=Eumeta variegata TaxID=151549 RepID=A0A4C1U6M7_EUMVA|nr:hypothetical protein EVAR_10924_1 [Eumeta japonica]